MTEPTWVSVLPPLLAIGLAIATRQVYISLAAGVWLGWTILGGWNPIAGVGQAIEGMVAVLGDPGNAKVILFTLVIGALIATVEASGGVRGFVQWVEEKRWVTNGRRAQFLAWIVGVVIFIESNITVLVAGAVSRPLFDRFRISREKLAYIIDSTSAPICILIPLNAWGAYVLGLLGTAGVERPLSVFVGSIPLNFYALTAVLLTLATVVFGINLGPMKRAERRTQEGEVLSATASPLLDPDVLSPEPNDRIPPRAVNMFLPILAMVIMMPISLFITGDGDLRAGSGSTSVLWAVLTGLAVAWVLLVAQRANTVDELTRIGLRGAGGLMSLALVLLLALALGAVARELGTGVYLAQATAGLLPGVIFLPLVFIVAAGIAFSTGTSWGTFAIMIPIAVPAAQALGMPPEPFVAAALSGGIFGDHASPISDTTIIASMAAATDHIDHVRTQLPYALIAGSVAITAFAITGALL
ncbi:MAG TPA: Na+/H+ antiporter NhaC family protein [Longimicrobiales bacterium]|nr:Na+/H+ antiporter NhaC family protein [Longimicrobiales bacterium]